MSTTTSLAATKFFFQAEDGIRDRTVTGVQTCALPICTSNMPVWTSERQARHSSTSTSISVGPAHLICSCEIGRASCRARVYLLGVEVSTRKSTQQPNCERYETKSLKIVQRVVCKSHAS